MAWTIGNASAEHNGQWLVVATETTMGLEITKAELSAQTPSAEGYNIDS